MDLFYRSSFSQRFVDNKVTLSLVACRKLLRSSSFVFPSKSFMTESVSSCLKNESLFWNASLKFLPSHYFAARICVPACLPPLNFSNAQRELDHNIISVGTYLSNVPYFPHGISFSVMPVASIADTARSGILSLSMQAPKNETFSG